MKTKKSLRFSAIILGDPEAVARSIKITQCSEPMSSIKFDNAEVLGKAVCRC